MIAYPIDTVCSLIRGCPIPLTIEQIMDMLPEYEERAVKMAAIVAVNEGRVRWRPDCKFDGS